jgi:hypothetical protein
VRVKAKKRTVGKFVCQAGVSPYEAIPADLVIGDELPLGGDTDSREGDKRP